MLAELYAGSIAAILPEKTRAGARVFSVGEQRECFLWPNFSRPDRISHIGDAFTRAMCHDMRNSTLLQ